MSGISGLISKKDIDIRANLLKMTQIIAHRGPDIQDLFVHNNIGLGYRGKNRYNIANEAQYHNSIVFDGQIYNYHEIKSKLESEGYAFNTQSVTELIMASYDYWGHACLNMFNGMWSFAIYDKQKQILFCARDRFGIKPFYYLNTEQYYAFASEIKQFTVLPYWQAKLNRQETYEFLSWGKSNTNKDTFFENVKQLTAGSYLIYDFKNKSFVTNRWYSLDPQKMIDTDFETAKANLYSLLKSSIEYCYDNNLKTCTSLSGGIDSSSIAVIAEKLLTQRQTDGYLNTISAVSKHKEYDESDYAKSVLESGRYNASFVYTEFDDLVKDFDSIIWHQEEPFASAGTVAQWKIAKTAKDEQIAIVLDGQGADEIFGGYLQSFGNLYLGHARSFKLFDLINEIKNAQKIHGFTTIDNVKKVLTSLANKQLYSLFVNSSMLGSKWIKDRQGIDIYPHWKTINTSLRTELISQITATKLPVLTHGVDRNTMAHSIESRMPFLDYRLAEFALSLPDKYKIYKGITKYVLREAMRGQLPDMITNRHDKKGFITPEEIWVKQNPDFFINEIKSTVSIANSFIDPLIIKYFAKTIAGEIKYDHNMFSFISFGRWLQQFNVQL